MKDRQLREKLKINLIKLDDFNLLETEFFIDNDNPMAEFFKHLLKAIGMLEKENKELNHEIYELMMRQKAIRDYLGVKFQFFSEPDPAYQPPEPKMRESIKCIKIKKENV